MPALRINETTNPTEARVPTRSHRAYWPPKLGEFGRILPHHQSNGSHPIVRSARCLLWSFDFGEIEALQHAGAWEKLASLIIDAAQRLERAGADFLDLLQYHDRIAEDIPAAVQIPLLHIADPTAERIKAQGIKRVGLLGTGFTTEQEFYKGQLEGRFDRNVLVPDADDRAAIHRVICDELVRGQIQPASRAASSSRARKV